MPKPKRLNPECKTLILAEGLDAKLFLIWALEAYHLESIQVEAFDGNSKLSVELKIWKLSEGFNNIETIIIARDAETNGDAAIESVLSVLKSHSLPLPAKAFQYSAPYPKVAIMLFPGLEMEAIIQKGTLEDLCLRTIEQTSTDILTKSETFVKQIDDIRPINRKHKANLHTYLSVNEKYIGLKVGEAARCGAWDWQSDAMAPFRNILENAV